LRPRQDIAPAARDEPFSEEFHDAPPFVGHAVMVR
jgi:hypothetical protein